MKPSYYYKYNFTSPEPIYAQVKEELKSYFQTGVVDDVLFPIYTEKCLNKLGRASYKIEENIFQLSNFECKLPDNFEAVREVWLTTSTDRSYRLPNAHYEQSTIRIGTKRDRCTENKFCPPDEIKVTYKTTGEMIQTFNCHYLLKPGNIHAKDSCSLDSFNVYSDSDDTFDIRNGKIYTNFPEGTLYMVYYAKVYDESEYQLIPDNDRIKDYIEAEIKYKCFETIYNNISDETLNQVFTKLQYYERKRDEARVLAETELRRQTLEQQIRATKSARNRLRKFNIS
jgi:hypothetical protein